MGFFSVAVFMTDKNQSVDELLAPYDEELCVEPFLYRTKAEIIEQEREKLQWDFKHEYRDWQKDPKAYEKEHNDPSYIQYLKSIPERMKWTDEQIYQDAIKGLEDDLNENGDQMSYRNPNTRFDHQETGGRFKGVLIRKGAGPESEGCDEAFVREIDFEAMHQRALAEPYLGHIEADEPLFPLVGNAYRRPPARSEPTESLQYSLIDHRQLFQVGENVKAQ